LNSLQDSKTGR